MTEPSPRSQRRHGRPAVLADGWYSWLGDPTDVHPWEPLTAALAELLGARLAGLILARGFLRGLAFALLSTRYSAAAIVRNDRGWRTLLLTRALLGRRRKLVAFQFFDHPPASLLDRLWRPVDRWAIRRALALAQVVTEAELAVYPARFGIPAARVRFLRFPARTRAVDSLAPVPRSNGPVVAAGRAYCDWPTVFAAAGGRGWDLQVVCSAEDYARVDALNHELHAGAQISVELPAPETHALLSRATVSIVAVTEGLIGRGHIRLADATDRAVAIVSTDVSSLRGYVVDDVTALVVAPGDPVALRTAVERLLHDPGRRAELTAAAWERAGAWTGRDYLRALQALAAQVASEDASAD